MLQVNLKERLLNSQITVFGEESTSISRIPNLAVKLNMCLILSTCVNPIEMSRIYAHI